MAWEIESPTTKPSGAESLGQRAKRVGISTAIKPVEVVEGLGNLLFQNAPQPAEYLKEKFGLSPEYLEPQGFGESFVQKLGQSAPFAALGGLPSLVSSGIGAAVGAGAQQLGASEGLQDIAQIGSEIAAGRIPSNFPGAEKYLRSIPGLSKTISLESELAKAAGSSIPLKTAATGITDAVGSVENLLSKETDPKVIKEISNSLDTIKSNLVGGEVSSSAAEKIRKNLFTQQANAKTKIDTDKFVEYINPLVKALQSPKSGIPEALQEVGNLLSKETNPKVIKQVSGIMDTIKNNITGGNITPANAMQIRKNLYTQSKGIEPSKAADYIQPLTKGINDFFAAYAAENPTFWKHLDKRDRLNEMKHMRSYMADWVEKSLTPLSKLKGGQLGELIGQIPAKVLGGATSFTLGRGEKFIRTLLTNPQGRKYYFNMVKAAGANDPAVFGKNFGHLINMFPKEFPEAKAEFTTEEPKWIIE